MPTEEEFEMWWREHGRLDHEPRHDQARMAWITATQRTAQRCVEICETAPDLLQNSTFDGVGKAIREEFLS